MAVNIDNPKEGGRNPRCRVLVVGVGGGAYTGSTSDGEEMP